MNGKKLLESSAESVHDDLRLRHEYLLAANRIMRQQITGRVQLTNSERKELAEIGAKWGKQALEEIATVAQADTILAWNRKFTDQKIDTSQPAKAVGRPRVDQEIEDFVIPERKKTVTWGEFVRSHWIEAAYPLIDETFQEGWEAPGMADDDRYDALKPP